MIPLHSRKQDRFLITLIFYREKGDASKLRDFLPSDKQYLVVRGVPCLRRATSLAYTDADEDAERLLSFADGLNGAPDGDEWVETHAGRKASNKGADHGEIAEIPDMDGHGEDDNDLVGAVRGMSIGEGKEPEIIDIDEIPDMEEDDLEAGDEATAAPKVPVVVPSTSAPAANR
jgi:ubiquitin-like-conjugating enzyme ATG3